MGNLTVLQARTELRYRVGNPTPNDVADSQLNNLLTWALIEITNPDIHKHREMQASTPSTGVGPPTDNAIILTTGVQNYPLPSNCVSLYDIWNFTKGYKLLPRPQWWMDERPNNPAAAGQPRMYFTFGNSFNLLNVPTTVENGQFLVARYWQEPTLPADGTVFPLRAAWDEVIILGSCYRYWLMRSSYVKAEASKTTFDSQLTRVSNQLGQDIFNDPDYELQVDITGQQWSMIWR